MSKKYNLYGWLFFVFVVILFWTTTWDSFEILIDNFLEKYWIKNDTNRLYINMILSLTCLIIIIYVEGLNLAL